MITIKFRGKGIYNVEWFYGDLLQNSNSGHCYIVFNFVEQDYIDYSQLVQAVQVDPKTIGQFTGLHDKNGVEIYEGDVVKAFYYDGSNETQIGNVKGIDNVIFSDGCFKLENETIKAPIGYEILETCKFIEVIGNIHEEEMK